MSLGFILGLVTVLKTFGFLSLRVVFRVVLCFFYYCLIGFRVFLASRGILLLGYILGFFYGMVGFRFVMVQSCFTLWVGLFGLRLFRV